MNVKMLKAHARRWLDHWETPAHARAAAKADRSGLPQFDPGPKTAIDEGIAWLCRAQDNSKMQDGGVARHFSLINGWSSSYPETTGYIADTLLICASESCDEKLLARVKRMLDWLVSIQFADGAFQGGMVDELPLEPATFDTGQILIGLAAGAHLDERYHRAMIRAADWLVNNQDADGCWRNVNTRFAASGEKVYETHVAIGLFRASQVEAGRGYLEAARKQVDWALTRQHPNGWFESCCLTDQANPLTHALGYALRGIVEAYIATQDSTYLDAACRTSEGAMSAMSPDGRLPGRLDEHWRGQADWVCLTGSAQFAESLFLLSGPARRDDFRTAASRANSYVRRTIATGGPNEIRGGVKGSFPVDGWYGRWQYLNWACKFMIDANRAELRSIEAPQ